MCRIIADSERPGSTPIVARTIQVAWIRRGCYSRSTPEKQSAVLCLLMLLSLERGRAGFLPLELGQWA